nr:kinesin protein kif3b [Hymenolepis microstoma]
MLEFEMITLPSLDSSSGTDNSFSVKEIENVMDIGNKCRSVGESHILVGKLNLIDLTDSELLRKSHKEDKRRKENKEVNLGLVTLGEVKEKRSHDERMKTTKVQNLEAKLFSKYNTRDGIVALEDYMKMLLNSTRNVFLRKKGHENALHQHFRDVAKNVVVLFDGLFSLQKEFACSDIEFAQD